MHKPTLMQITEEKVFDPDYYRKCIFDIRKSIYILFNPDKNQFGIVNTDYLPDSRNGNKINVPVIAILPPVYPEKLGDPSFTSTHKVRFPYIGGAMARGISSPLMVKELARHGMLGFFGTGGLNLEKVEEGVSQISNSLNPMGLSWGANLIHTPDKLSQEENTIDIYLKYGVRKMSAAAFMDITPGIVRYACKGLYKDIHGMVHRTNYIFAKVSRPEVARHFLQPAPEAIVNNLLINKKITRQEAELIRQIPLSEDIDIEGDSGGHTDNRPLMDIYPVIRRLGDEISDKYGYKTHIRMGAAGGLGTPEAVAAAFSLGASNVTVGSVLQSTIEAGTSVKVKKMLSKAGVADTIMAPSADMFELGAKVQVLKAGTMMGIRGNLLMDIYKKYDSLDDIPDITLRNIEDNIFKRSIYSIWNETKEYFMNIDPRQVEKANTDKKYKMALIFRWYLGNSSIWPIIGQEDRTLDYQIWCSPAMGAFNNWVKGSFLEDPENRSVQQVALNMLEGAAILTRLHQIRTIGFPLNQDMFHYKPEWLKI